MTTDDDETKRFGKAVIALTEASLALAEAYDVCPLCLMYEAASIAEEAEEAGEAQHRGTPRQTHPTHKTIV
jgi:hypothetical protein